MLKSPLPAREMKRKSQISKDDAKTDAKLEEALRTAHERASGPMSTEKSRQESATFIEQMRTNQAGALLRSIERKEIITSKELQDRLQVRRRYISDAVKAGRLFAIESPSGEHYYPAFYADLKYDRRALEKVAETLGCIPASMKYHFFTSKSHFLGSKTPLDALLEGRLADVLIAASGFAER